MGKCACVTCGKVLRWGGKGKAVAQGGHFISRMYTGTLLHPYNIHVQCASCNKWLNSAPIEYEIFMQHTYGPELVRSLKQMAETDLTEDEVSYEELRELAYGLRARIKELRLVMGEEE